MSRCIECVNRIPVSTYLARWKSPPKSKIDFSRSRNPPFQTEPFQNFRADRATSDTSSPCPPPPSLSTWTANRDKRLSQLQRDIDTRVSNGLFRFERKKREWRGRNIRKPVINPSSFPFPLSRKLADLDRSRLYSADTSWCATYVTDASVSLLCHNRGSWSRSSCRSIKHASL